MNQKLAGEYSERYEYMADRYRAITYSKRVEQAMAKEGFPGEVSFMGRPGAANALFFPEQEELGVVFTEGTTLINALTKLIHKLLTESLDEFRRASGEHDAN